MKSMKSMKIKLMFALWAILLPIMVADAAIATTYDFSIALFQTGAENPGSKIANHFKQAVSKATGASLKEIEETVLESPDSRFDFPLAVDIQSNMTYTLPNGTAFAMKLSYGSDTSIVPLPFSSVVQNFGKSLQTAFRDVVGVAFILEGYQSSPIYYFPTLSEERRPIGEQAKIVFDYWTPDRIASAESRDMKIAGSRSFFRKGRTLQAKIGDSPWTQGGVVQTAVGRLLFTFSGKNFMCTATAVTELAKDRTVIITAAHCAYDDKNKKFASSALFIPDQDSTTGTSTNFNCYDDPLGCWATSFAVVDNEWASQTWSANVEHDYAFYAVNNKGSHSGTMDIPSALDEAVATLPVDFTTSAMLKYAHGFGYPGNRDPDFRYYADIATSSAFNGYMMEACDLQASSSGGPWFHPFDLTTGSGKIISVNSYGYASKVPSGMGGPKLFGNSAKCLFDVANSYNMDAPNNGYIVDFSNGCPVTPADTPIAPTTAVSSVAPSTDTPTQAPTDAPVVQCVARQLNCADAKFSCCQIEYCGSFVGEKLIKLQSNKGKGKGKTLPVSKKVKYNYSQCALKKARNGICEKNNECVSGTCKKKRCT